MVLESNYSLENFDPEVLREYDIRGIVGSNLNENTAIQLVEHLVLLLNQDPLRVLLLLDLMGV